jgi:hypothetical protein
MKDLRSDANITFGSNSALIHDGQGVARHRLACEINRDPPRHQPTLHISRMDLKKFPGSFQYPVWRDRSPASTIFGNFKRTKSVVLLGPTY